MNIYKYTREKFDPRIEIPTRKNFGPTKYPREKIPGPQNTHAKKSWIHEIFFLIFYLLYF